MNKVFIFNGPPNSGKDFICSKLKSDYGFRHLEFKAQLFEDTCNYFSVSRHWFDKGYTRETKEISERLLGGRSRRDALIYVSENIMKKKYGEDYYGLKLAQVVNSIEDNICISDGGFSDEMGKLLEIVDKKVFLLRVYREGCDFSKDSRSYVKTFNTNMVIKHGVGDYSVTHRYTQDTLNFPFVVDYYNNGNEDDISEFLRVMVNI